MRENAVGVSIPAGHAMWACRLSYVTRLVRPAGPALGLQWRLQGDHIPTPTPHHHTTPHNGLTKPPYHTKPPLHTTQCYHHTMVPPYHTTTPHHTIVSLYHNSTSHHGFTIPQLLSTLYHGFAIPSNHTTPLHTTPWFHHTTQEQEQPCNSDTATHYYLQFIRRLPSIEMCRKIVNLFREEKHMLIST